MNRCKNKNTTFWKLNRRKNDMAVVNFFSLSLPLSLSPSLPLLPDSLSSLSPSLPLSSLTPSPPSLPLLPDSLSPSLPLSLSPSLPPSLKHPSHLTSFPLTSSSLPLSTPFPPSLCLRLSLTPSLPVPASLLSTSSPVSLPPSLSLLFS